jgi:tight adherence protein B
VLDFARTAGVPAVALLRSEADGCRRAARALAARRAVELETRLLLPLGLCVLPAFVLLGVMPIALAIVSSTVVEVG